MIYVITDEGESTTDHVLLYLIKAKINFVRLHISDAFTDLRIRIGCDKNEDEKVLINDSLNITITNKDFIWYRRGNFSIHLPSNVLKRLPKTLLKNIDDEVTFIKKYLYSNYKYLSSYFKEVHSNKLIDLKNARDAGFLIPSTLITTRKEDLLSFYESHPRMITKPIHNGHISFELENKRFKPKGIIMVDDEVINKTSDVFLPSLFQEYIEKEVEIRVFFYRDKFFPMAIFSQNDSKTFFDYRNYNRSKPNRNVPFRFSPIEEKKLLEFVKSSRLTSGSIDIILSKKNKFYFLEVNPIGQFGWVSKNCNYYIEKKIANYIINETN